MENQCWKNTYFSGLKMHLTQKHSKKGPEFYLSLKMQGVRIGDKIHKCLKFSIVVLHV